MDLEEILGGSIAIFIVVLVGVFILPLAERLTGQTLLLVTVPLAAAGAYYFIGSLRALGRGGVRQPRSLRIQATRAGVVFASAGFWSVILSLPLRFDVIKVYDALALDGKLMLWFGITFFIILRVYLSLLTRTTPLEELEAGEISNTAAAIRVKPVRKS